MSSDKIWIYLEDEKEFKQIERDDPKLSWKGYCPNDGQVVYRRRKNEKMWRYVYFAETPELLADRVNWWRRRDIIELERKIIEMRKGLVVPPAQR